MIFHRDGDQPRSHPSLSDTVSDTVPLGHPALIRSRPYRVTHILFLKKKADGTDRVVGRRIERSKRAHSIQRRLCSRALLDHWPQRPHLLLRVALWHMAPAEW